MNEYAVERIDPAADFGELQRILALTREVQLPPRWLQWRYFDNPDGAAVAWALRTSDGPVGVSVCMPRRFRAAGRTLRAWTSVDFSILSQHRTLGPALLLRRAPMRAIDDGEADLLLTFPNERMAAVSRIAGFVKLGALSRLVSPTSAARYVRRVADIPLFASAITALADTALRTRELLSRPLAPEVTIATESLCFGEEFDSLFERCASMLAPLGVRDARWLSWRYLEDPTKTYDLLTARRGARLTGYAVFATSDHQLHVTSLFAESPEVTHDLARFLVREARRRELTAVSATVVDHSVLASMLLSAGYWRRTDPGSILGYVPARSGVVGDAAHWYLTMGDRDV